MIVYVVMGVSGCGKSTVGRALARKADLDFIEGDNLHSDVAITKMSSGKPLSDGERVPWLRRICKACHDSRNTRGVVVACSALKRSYRDLFRDVFGERVRFLYIDLDAETLRQRLASRGGHFMPSSLLSSQLQTLEVPDKDELHCVVSGSLGVQEQLEQILQWMREDSTPCAVGPGLA